MSSPRQPHYDFAHRLLAHDAHTDPSVFERLEHQAQPYLAARWHQASGQPQLPNEVFAFPLVRVPLHAQNAEIGTRVVRMPRPEQATEAYYAAFVRDSREPMRLRYFVAERSADGQSASWAEWTGNPQMPRIRYDALSPNLPPNSGPVSTNEPFLDDFVRKVVQEVASQQPAQAMAPGGFGQGGFGQGGFGRGAQGQFHQGMVGARPGTQPQAKAKGNGMGCVIALVLIVAGGGGFYWWSDKQAKARFALYQKHQDRIQEAVESAEEAKAQPGVDRCTADVKKRILAVRELPEKTKPPTSPVPTAHFACDDGSEAPTGTVSGTCDVPTGVQRASLIDTPFCHADSSEARAELARLVTTDKPWGGVGQDKRIEEWEEKIEEAIEEIEKADAKIKAPPVLAVGGGECHTYVAATFVSDRTGEKREVVGYDCDVKLSWVDAKGTVLGEMRASGRGKPDAAVVAAQTLQEPAILESNRNAQNRALDDAWTKVGKQLDVRK
jgi:hypothetical protein